MKKIAYFDCQCGAAGDMILAAMLDAGLDQKALLEQIDSLKLEELEGIDIRQVSKNAIRALKFTPIIAHHSHSHDDHHHNHHEHKHHNHRHLGDIIKIINNSSISDKAKKDACEIFNRLAEVEGKIHSKPPEQIHFHEVGATDSIVDIVGCCIGFDYFKFDKIYCSAISLGAGSVQCAHGTVPVPAPATAELAKGMPVKDGPVDFELLTPTGAAVLSHFVDEFAPMPTSKLTACGYGSGTKDFDGIANVLRLRIAELEQQENDAQDVWLIETNIDDCTGELIGYVCGKLFEQKALDVWTSPIYMKKNRPAIKLSVLCEEENIDNIEQEIFTQGITLGIRKCKMQRTILQRKFTTKHTPNGDIRLKQGFYKGEKVFEKPEFDSLYS